MRVRPGFVAAVTLPVGASVYLYAAGAAMLYVVLCDQPKFAYRCEAYRNLATFGLVLVAIGLAAACVALFNFIRRR
jgi:hypothetical protein